MDNASKEVEVEKKMLNDEIAILEKLLKTVPADSGEIKFQYKFVNETRLSSYRRSLNKYSSLLLSNNKSDEYSKEKSEEAEFDKKLVRLSMECEQYISGAQGGGGGHADQYRIHLPRRELPKFSGNVREYLSFWAAFNEIHIDKNIPTPEKFHYLLHSTVPDSPARKVVESYPMSAPNYQLAVDALKENFGRDNMLIKVYIRDLIGLITADAKGKRGLTFTELVTTLTGQLRNLETLGVTKDKCGLLLYPIVESCIPEPILKDFMKSTSYKEELEVLMEFLKNEVRREIETSLAQAPYNLTASSDPWKERKTNQHHDKKDKFEKKKEVQLRPTVSSLLSGGGNSDNCGFCDGSHPTHECMRAVTMSCDERKERLINSKSCLKCLKKNHNARNCRARVKCLCGGPHHALMCFKLAAIAGDSSPHSSHQNDKKEASQNQNQSNQPPSSVSSLHNGVKSPLVPLMTLRLIAYGPNGKKRNIRALIDPGSQRSYVKKDIADYLQLKVIGQEHYTHELFGGVVTPVQTYDKMKIIVSDTRGRDHCEFELSSKEVISSHAVLPLKGKWMKEFSSRGINFTDLESNSNEIELLLGNKLTHKIFTGKKCSLPNGLGALECRWGWVLSGELPAERNSQTTELMISNFSVNDRPLSDLWALEALGIEDSGLVQSRKELEESALHHFNSTVMQLDDHRYQVQLPFINGLKDVLPTNRLIAERRLLNTTKHLNSSGYFTKYNDVFEQWTAEGLIEEVQDNTETSSVHYLPHRPVIKPSSTTTPIRPVYDASCRVKGSLSLNDALEKGPNTLELIPTLLTRFRLNQIGVLSDIRKAFQQISVYPPHRDFLRFLWWTDETCKKIKVFRHNRVVFGVSSSPFLLGATLQHHLNRYPENKIATELRNSFYVDNSVISLPSQEEAIEFKMEAIELLKSGAFELRDWVFGPTEIESTQPVLGMLWKTAADNLQYDLKSVTEKFGQLATKRRLLSILHSLYDPLGWLSPFILQGKLLMKEVQQEKMGWDIQFGTELTNKFSNFTSQIPLIENYAIPRYIALDASSSSSVHVFCDASEDAYAVAIYLRSIVQGDVRIDLLEAKSRVTPPKKLTIPRLELLACLIAIRLMVRMKKTLRIQNIPITYWTDSSTALSWITGDGPWATFVNNRVQEIRSDSDSTSWRHVPGKLNPADLPSRGCSMKKLLESDWLRGPDWLYLNEEQWPQDKIKPNQVEVEREMKNIIVTSTAPERVHPLSILHKFSSYDKVVRVLVYVLRFIKSVGKGKIKQTEPRRSNPEVIPVPAITKEETDEAEHLLFQYIQNGFEAHLEKYKRLKPFKDNSELWRIESRLTHEDSSNFKAPLLLPDKNYFVNLLISKEHHSLKHAGTQVVLANLRERFWIINGRRTVRKVLKSCGVCRRYIQKRIEVPPAPLPSLRTTTATPFATTGVDMAGPFILRDGSKAWMILFTCAVYRGIHLELVQSLSTDAFLEAFRSFASARGRPEVIYSDNGLNFVGAAKLFREIDWNEVENYASTNRISWRFNPPSAAWWGGWWERLIGLVKQLVIRNLGKRNVHFTELRTLLKEIENVWNSRPLTYLSEATDDPVPLSPNHFLRNAVLSYIPEVDVKDGRSLRKAHQKLQNLREVIRARFRKEYLGLLIHQHQQKTQQLKIGDVVLLEQDNTKRVEWPLGVIVDILKGRDNISRTYQIKTKLGTVLRPAQRLFPLEVQEPEATAAATVEDGEAVILRDQA